MVQKDDIDSQQVALVGVFGAILTFVVICGAQVLYYRAQKADAFHKVVEPGHADIRDMETEQRQGLAEYRWVDRDKQTFTIPIERAMELLAHPAAAAARP